MKGKMYVEETVENTERKFGENQSWIACDVVGADSTVKMGFFTHDQVEKAIIRASKNPEDIPKPSFWEKVFGK